MTFALRAAWRRLGGNAGVAIVQFALVMPIFFFVVLVGLQFGMLIVQYYSITHVARDTARWTGIHPDTTDSTIVAHAMAINLPLAGASGITSVTVNPSCTTLVSGQCSNRPSGNTVTVTVTPNVSRAIFLPTSFRMINWQIFTIPTSMPAYSVTVLIE